jgi:hypothetical protein
LMPPSRQPARTLLSYALLALALLLAAAIQDSGAPLSAPLRAESCLPETGALQRGASNVPPAGFEGRARTVSGSSARDQSVDELEGVGRTSPRGQDGAGAFGVYVASGEGKCWAVRDIQGQGPPVPGGTPQPRAAAVSQAGWSGHPKGRAR